MKRTKLLIFGVVLVLAILIIYASINWLPNFFGGGNNTGTPQLGDLTTLQFEVGRARINCQNGFGSDCLSVNGAPFLQEIEDFNHQNGCSYTINVERRVAFDPATVPQETSIYRYRLLAITTRTC